MCVDVCRRYIYIYIYMFILWQSNQKHHYHWILTLVCVYVWCVHACAYVLSPAPALLTSQTHMKQFTLLQMYKQPFDRMQPSVHTVWMDVVEVSGTRDKGAMSPFGPEVHQTSTALPERCARLSKTRSTNRAAGSAQWRQQCGQCQGCQGWRRRMQGRVKTLFEQRFCCIIGMSGLRKEWLFT